MTLIFIKKHIYIYLAWCDQRLLDYIRIATTLSQLELDEFDLWFDWAKCQKRNRNAGCLARSRLQEGSGSWCEQVSTWPPPKPRSPSAPQPFTVDQLDVPPYVESNHPVTVHLLTASIGDLKYTPWAPKEHKLQSMCGGRLVRLLVRGPDGCGVSVLDYRK